MTKSYISRMLKENYIINIFKNVFRKFNHKSNINFIHISTSFHMFQIYQNKIFIFHQS